MITWSSECVKDLRECLNQLLSSSIVNGMIHQEQTLPKTFLTVDKREESERPPNNLITQYFPLETVREIEKKKGLILF